MWHIWDRGLMCGIFWLETLKGRDHSEDPGIDEK
jgi:hypothetical protein